MQSNQTQKAEGQQPMATSGGFQSSGIVGHQKQERCCKQPSGHEHHSRTSVLLSTRKPVKCQTHRLQASRSKQDLCRAVGMLAWRSGEARPDLRVEARAQHAANKACVRGVAGGVCQRRHEAARLRRGAPLRAVSLYECTCASRRATAPGARSVWLPRMPAASVPG